MTGIQCSLLLCVFECPWFQVLVDVAYSDILYVLLLLTGDTTSARGAAIARRNAAHHLDPFWRSTASAMIAIRYGGLDSQDLWGLMLELWGGLLQVWEIFAKGTRGDRVRDLAGASGKMRRHVGSCKAVLVIWVSLVHRSAGWCRSLVFFFAAVL